MAKHSNHLALVEWLRSQPPTVDGKGHAAGVLYEKAQAAGVYPATRQAWHAKLNSLEAAGIIDRERDGKRTYRIEAVNPIIKEAPVVSEPEPEPVITNNVHQLHEGVTVTENSEAPSVTVAITINWTGPMDKLPDALVKMSQQYGVGVTAGGDEVVAAERQIARRSSPALDSVARWFSEVETAINKLAAQQHRGPVLAASSVTSMPRPASIDFHSLGVKDQGMQKLIRDLAADGWMVECARNGHLKVTKPGHKPAQLAKTPSDHRGVKNSRSRMRGLGANV